MRCREERDRLNRLRSASYDGQEPELQPCSIPVALITIDTHQSNKQKAAP